MWLISKPFCSYYASWKSCSLFKKQFAHHMNAMKQHWATYDGWAKDLDCSRACCVIVIVAIVAYSVDTDTEDGSSSSKLDNSSAQNVLLFLPSVLYPLPGKYHVVQCWRTSLSLEVKEINFLYALAPAGETPLFQSNCSFQKLVIWYACEGLYKKCNFSGFCCTQDSRSRR